MLLRLVELPTIFGLTLFLVLVTAIGLGAFFAGRRLLGPPGDPQAQQLATNVIRVAGALLALLLSFSFAEAGRGAPGGPAGDRTRGRTDRRHLLRPRSLRSPAKRRPERHCSPTPARSSATSGAASRTTGSATRPSDTSSGSRVCCSRWTCRIRGRRICDHVCSKTPTTSPITGRPACSAPSPSRRARSSWRCSASWW